MNDFSVSLNPAEQRAIAIWGMKTAMVFECTAPREEWYYSKADRDHLLASLSPPAGTVIWLGRFHRSNISAVQAMRLFGATRAPGGQPDNDPILGEGNLITFVLSRLVIQVLTLRPASPRRTTRVNLYMQPGDWGRRLAQVWPVLSPARWPPPLSFNEEGIEELCKRFTDPPW